MPTSAAGNKFSGHTQRGFTLMELMVVVALIAMATAGVALSLRDGASTALERDAQRLAAVLEAARAQARASDTAVWWQPEPDARGHVLRGLPGPAQPQAWLSEHTRVRHPVRVQLGPEPLIGAQRIELFSKLAPQHSLWVVTDGLRPFAVQPTAARQTP
ncbi:MAG: Tfp pilus assembly protein FimT/FimU [Limnohabitans sp.]